MAEVIRSDGTRQTVTPKNGRVFELDELKAVVNGWIEIVALRRANKRMVVNEEGLLENLPLNTEATRLYRENTLPNDNIIVGDVLVCEWDEIE